MLPLFHSYLSHPNVSTEWNPLAVGYQGTYFWLIQTHKIAIDMMRTHSILETQCEEGVLLGICLLDGLDYHSLIADKVSSKPIQNMALSQAPNIKLGVLLHSSVGVYCTQARRGMEDLGGCSKWFFSICSDAWLVACT